MDTHHGTGAVTRVLLDSSDGQDELGVDRRLGEHHRGLVGGAGRLARVRLPARERYRAAPPAPAREQNRMPATSRGPSARAGAEEPAGGSQTSPAARAPGPRGARGGAGARGDALGEALAGPDARALRAPVRRVARRRRRGGGLLGDERPASRGQGPRLGHRRRGGHQPVQLRGLGQLPAVRGRDARVLRHRPGDARPRPGRRRRGGRRANQRVSAGGHPRLPGGDAGDRADRGRARPRDLWRMRARPPAPWTPRASESARAATWRPSPSTPTSS